MSLLTQPISILGIDPPAILALHTKDKIKKQNSGGKYFFENGYEKLKTLRGGRRGRREGALRGRLGLGLHLDCRPPATARHERSGQAVGLA